LRAVSVLLDMILEPSLASFWSALAALAAIIQGLLLLVNAIIVWDYLQETKKLRVATQDQVEETKKLVFAERRQLEAQIRPAVVGRMKMAYDQLFVQLVNIGSGPALDVRLSAVGRGSVEQWDGVNEPFPPEPLLAFIERGGERLTSVRTREVKGLGGIDVLGDRSFRCEYQSLSGRIYSTVVDFDQAGVCVERTSFSELPDMD
jgi:hypothetical protein